MSPPAITEARAAKNLLFNSNLSAQKVTFARSAAQVVEFLHKKYSRLLGSPKHQNRHNVRSRNAKEKNDGNVTALLTLIETLQIFDFRVTWKIRRAARYGLAAGQVRSTDVI